MTYQQILFNYNLVDTNPLVPVESLLALKQSDPSSVKVTFQHVRALLTPYQKVNASYHFLAKNSIEASVCGAGKTVISIGLISLLRRQNPKARVLLVVPSYLVTQWQEEIIKHSYPELHDDLVVLYGTKDKRKKIYKYLQTSKLVLTTYSMIRNDIENVKVSFDQIILDEASCLRNPDTALYKSIQLVANSCPRRLALTATPVEKRAENYHSLYALIKPNLLPTLQVFKSLYCVEQDVLIRNSGNRYRDIIVKKLVGYKNLDQLRTVIAPFFIRRTREEIIAELPPLTTRDIELEMGKKQRSEYDKIKKGVIEDVGSGKVTKLQAIQSLIYLLKTIDGLFSSNLTSDTDSIKLEFLDHLLQTDLENESFLLYTNYHSTVDYLYEYISNKYKTHRVYKYTGKTDYEERDEIKKDFNSSEYPVILIATKAASKGLNLQGKSRIVVFYSFPWLHSDYEQILGRVYRKGQKNAVVVYNLIAKDTYDSRVQAILKQGKSVSDNLVDFENIDFDPKSFMHII